MVEYSLALLSFGIGRKTDLYSPVAIAEYSKLAGILSAALSQHHVLGFEIAQNSWNSWNSIISTSFVSSNASS